MSRPTLRLHDCGTEHIAGYHADHRDRDQRLGIDHGRLLYNPAACRSNGEMGPNVTDLTALPGGSGKIALALDDQGQVVGNGFLYRGGQFLSIQSLLPPPSSSQWSNLNATGINDAGQIVGQGMINGQEQASVMTPDGSSVPEPSTFLVFGLTAGAAMLRANGGPPRVSFA